MARQRQSREDAIRWIASVSLAALLASAATSAVFLAARPKPKPPATAAQQAADDQRQFALLAQSLTATVEADLARGNPIASNGPKRVEVVVELDHGAAQRIPLVSTASNMLTEAVATPWRMNVTSQQDVQHFARVVDIRRSPSLRQPGYIGIVELQIDRLTRRSELLGELPAKTPQGFEVITLAKYNELEETKQFQQRTEPAASQREVLLHKHYDNWQPVSPVPDDLPPAIAEQYHAVLAACDSAEPNVASHRETLSYYYSPQAGTWTPQPRGELQTSASP